MKIRNDLFKSIAILALVLVLIPDVSAQQRRTASRQAPGASFEKLSTEANDARETGNLDEAIRLYNEALKVKPAWVEGWWYIATLHYDRDEYEEAVRAFKRVTALKKDVGAPLVMLGLCEYRLGRYDDAFAHIQQGKRIGLGDNKDLSRVMRFHEGALWLLRGDFETAQGIFKALSYEGYNNQDLLIGTGLSVLRMSMLPKQIDINHKDRDLIRRAGLAQHYSSQLNAADARMEYERLTKDYPDAPNLHYALGRLLIDMRDDEAAIAAFEKEIKNSPTHALARLQIAYIKLRNRDPQAGLTYAEEAVKLNQRLPLGHYLLGRILFETGSNARAVEELEIAQRQAPGEPRIYYSLSRAYIKANRKEDANRALETFARLNKEVEAAKQRGDLKGEAIEEKDPE